MVSVFSKAEKVFLEVIDHAKKGGLLIQREYYNQFLEVLEGGWGKLPIGDIREISLGDYNFKIKHPSLGLLEVCGNKI